MNEVVLIPQIVLAMGATRYRASAKRYATGS